MMLPHSVSAQHTSSPRRRWLTFGAIFTANCCILLAIAETGTAVAKAHRTSIKHHPLAFVSPRKPLLRHPQDTLKDSIQRPSSTRRRIDNRREQAWRLFDSTAPTTESKTTTTAGNPNYKNGLYRPFAEHAWSKLISLNSVATLEDDHLVVPADLRHNVAPAKGFPEGSTVSMETRAIKSSSNSSLFRYARFALLETNVAVPSVNNTTANEPAAAAAKPIGIQVLNFVIVPHHSHLPVWGVDLVSLPGDRHLMLMDAQPVQQPESRILTEEYYKVWHDRHCLQKTHIFPWGGDIPPEAAQFVSQTALWTRLQGQSSDQVRAIVQGDLWLAFCEHLDLYLQLLQQHQRQQEGLLSIPQEEEDGDNKKGNDSADAINPFEAYLQYRLANDPARPMLRALYGPEWTERVLHEVLFPKL